MKNKQFPLRLPESIYENIKVLAKIKNRSINKMILHILQKEIVHYADEIIQELEKKQ